jgi:hypothetical protein
VPGRECPVKKKTYPSMLGTIAGTDVAITLHIAREGTLKLGTERQNDTAILERVIAEGFEQPLIFTIEDDLPQREMSRFLCKMALEAVAELFGPEATNLESALHAPFFDTIRNFARYGHNVKEWPYSHRRIYPHDTLMRHPDTHEGVQVGFGSKLFMDKHRETLYAFVLYGVEFVINVGGPSLQGFEEWLVDHGEISPMVERVGCHLTSEGEGASKLHYLHGNFDHWKGWEFDALQGYSSSMNVPNSNI